ncbi:hypothetical protein H4582DRAFT_2064948 [Lactarius indigo]|nr:hypothetical protein H4582DRAFT_2064948 [Lactarius indigo]
MSDTSRGSRSRSHAAAGTPQSQQASPKPQSMGPPSKQRSEASRVSTGFEFLSKVPVACRTYSIWATSFGYPDDGKRKKRRTPSPPKDFMDRIPLSQPKPVSPAPEIISIDDQPSDTPTAGAPTGSPTSAGLALSIADTMDVDDPGSSVQCAITPSQGRPENARSTPCARTGEIPPSTRTIKHRMGITIPVSPLPEDLRNVESRIERCKLTLADVWDELTELQGRVQAINDSILKTLIDLENMAKYLE